MNGEGNTVAAMVVAIVFLPLLIMVITKLYGFLKLSHKSAKRHESKIEKQPFSLKYKKQKEHESKKAANNHLSLLSRNSCCSSSSTER